MQSSTELQMPTTLQPLKALRALASVARNPEDTATGARMVGYLTGRSWERLFRRFAADPMGAKILSEGRRLEDELCDRDALAARPAGSLGRTYFEWTRDENISADGLIGATELAIPGADQFTPEQRLFVRREQVAHDLWHVVTGYGRDLLGEAALLHIMLIQSRITGLILPTLLSTLHLGFRSSGREVIRGARHRARHGAWLPGQDWESLLDQPLHRVREILKLGEPQAYTPVYER